jgi:Tfp pilus assembly protein PilV
MFIGKNLFIVVTIICAISVTSYASGSHEEKKEEPGEMPTGDIKKAPWMELESRVQDLQARIKSKRATIEQMLEEKNHLKNGSPELKALIENVVREHKEMRQMSEDYRKNLSLLQYRFPERNAKADRKYDRLEVKSLDEMEQAVGIDAKINRNLGRMRSQYKMQKADDSEKGIEAKSDTVKSPNKKSESIEEAGSILIHQ